MQDMWGNDDVSYVVFSSRVVGIYPDAVDLDAAIHGHYFMIIWCYFIGKSQYVIVILLLL